VNEASEPENQPERRPPALAIIAAMLLTSAAVLGEEVTVTTASELQAAVNVTRAAVIHLNAPLFTLTQNLSIDHSCTIDVLNQDATIDGHDTHGMRICSSDVNMGDPTGTYRLTIDSCGNGAFPAFRVERYTEGVNTVTLHHMTFTKGNNGAGTTGTGCSATGYVGTLNLTCNFCDSHHNDQDGFSGSGIGTVNLTLNNCNAYANGDGYTGGSGDGATIHTASHTLIVNGGSFHHNKKGGIYNVDQTGTCGSTCYVYGKALFYANGTSGRGIYADIVLRDACRLYIDGAEFRDLDATNAGKCHIWLTAEDGISPCNASIKMRNVVAHSSGGDEALGGAGQSGAAFMFNTTGDVAVENCLFYDMAKGTDSYVVRATGEELSIANCTFNNCMRFVRASGEQMVLRNNIFANARSYAISAGGSYTSNSLNGYNCFYGNSLGDFLSIGDVHSTTDIVCDPMFENAAMAGFQLLRGSPCVDTGSNDAVSPDVVTDLAGWPRIMDNLGSGSPVVDRGAYERQCANGPSGDFIGNCRVEFRDYAFLAGRWTFSECAPANLWCDGADMDESGGVEAVDILIFAAQWLEGM